MIFWIGILVAFGVGYAGFKAGFYQIWAVLFNLIFSCYLAIFLSPMFFDLGWAGSDGEHTWVLTIVVGGAFFAILQGASYILITGQFNVPFPKYFDMAGGAFFGFLTGCVAWSFLCLAIGMAPSSEGSFLSKMNFGENTKSVCFWCDGLNKVVSSDDTSAKNIFASIQLKQQEKDEQRKTAVAYQEKIQAEKQALLEAEKEATKIKRTAQEVLGSPPDINLADTMSAFQ